MWISLKIHRGRSGVSDLCRLQTGGTSNTGSNTHKLLYILIHIATRAENQLLTIQARCANYYLTKRARRRDSTAYGNKIARTRSIHIIHKTIYRRRYLSKREMRVFLDQLETSCKKIRIRHVLKLIKITSSSLNWQTKIFRNPICDQKTTFLHFLKKRLVCDALIWNYTYDPINGLSNDVNFVPKKCLEHCPLRIRKTKKSKKFL